MKKSASEFLVTIRDNGNVDKGDLGTGDKQYKTIAVSVKQAINNVAHRLGFNGMCFDRPNYADNYKWHQIICVTCPETDEEWWFV